MYLKNLLVILIFALVGCNDATINVPRDVSGNLSDDDSSISLPLGFKPVTENIGYLPSTMKLDHFDLANQSKVISPDKRTMYVYGGYKSKGDISNVLYKFDEKGWSELEPGPFPVAYSAITMNEDGSRLYIIGGRGTRGSRSDIVFYYDVAKKSYFTL